jgi:hypothetical protein
MKNAKENQQQPQQPTYNVAKDGPLIDAAFERGVEEAKEKSKAAGIGFFQLDPKTGRIINVNAENK